MKRILAYLFCIYICCSNWLWAQDPIPIEAETEKPEVTLAWDANTEADLAGYKLYRGLASGTYDTVVDPGNILKWKVASLEESTTYYFALTAYDTSGNESDYGNELVYTTGDFIAPSVPQNLRELLESTNLIINTDKVTVITSESLAH